MCKIRSYGAVRGHLFCDALEAWLVSNGKLCPAQGTIHCLVDLVFVSFSFRLDYVWLYCRLDTLVVNLISKTEKTATTDVNDEEWDRVS
jgi:hypothetical protein